MLCIWLFVCSPTAQCNLYATECLMLSLFIRTCKSTSFTFASRFRVNACKCVPSISMTLHKWNFLYCVTAQNFDEVLFFSLTSFPFSILHKFEHSFVAGQLLGSWLFWWDSKDFGVFNPNPHESPAQNRSGDPNRKIRSSTSAHFGQGRRI